LWSRISDALGALRNGEPLSAVFDQLRTPPEQSVAFAIAIIALSAKMAKADGLVTRDEVTAFREVFHIPQSDEKKAARVFNMARSDVAGYEDYAARIFTMFRNNNGTLCDLMEGLFHIAMADGQYHPAEDEFLERVSEIFMLSPRQFRGLRSRFVPDADPDPYDVLGISHKATLEEAKSMWRKLVRENHPDQMIARGVPEEAVKIAKDRMVAINRAWEEISGAHA
jgi:DnaJ like chaperone protein